MRFRQILLKARAARYIARFLLYTLVVTRWVEWI